MYGTNNLTQNLIIICISRFNKSYNCFLVVDAFIGILLWIVH